MAQAHDLPVAEVPEVAVKERGAIGAARLGTLAALVVAAALLVGSISQSYWNITLHAPQYPKGLHIRVFVNHMTGVPETIEDDVREVDGLNHYIGMIKLSDAATFEQMIAVPAIILIALAAVASWWLRGPWRLLARVPAVIYPVVFVADLFAWLWIAGNTLDKKAPLSSSIKPFTPRLLGVGKIGQFGTEASFALGFWMAAAAALITLGVVVWDWTRRRAAADAARGPEVGRDAAG